MSSVANNMAIDTLIVTCVYLSWCEMLVQQWLFTLIHMTGVQPSDLKEKGAVFLIQSFLTSETANVRRCSFFRSFSFLGHFWGELLFKICQFCCEHLHLQTVFWCQNDKQSLYLLVTWHVCDETNWTTKSPNFRNVILLPKSG